MNRAYLAAACWLGMLLIFSFGGWLLCLSPACPTQGLDEHILRVLYDIRTDRLDSFFLAATWAGSSEILLPLTLAGVLILASRNRPREALFLASSFIGASALAVLVKLLVARPRPALYPGCCLMPATPSFPSSHTTQITAFVVALLWLTRPYVRPVRYWAALLLGVLPVAIVGISRIYLQVHYVTDVLASIFTATLWVAGLGILILSGRRGGASHMRERHEK